MNQRKIDLRKADVRRVGLGIVDQETDRLYSNLRMSTVGLCSVALAHKQDLDCGFVCLWCGRFLDLWVVFRGSSVSLCVCGLVFGLCVVFMS